jgi:hypothetical protein
MQQRHEAEIKNHKFWSIYGCFLQKAFQFFGSFFPDPPPLVFFASLFSQPPTLDSLPTMGSYGLVMIDFKKSLYPTLGFIFVCFFLFSIGFFPLDFCA